MKHMKYLAISCLLWTICVWGNATVYSGSCGTNLTYSLDTSSGILTISGTGDMTDYSSYDDAPWYQYRDYITQLQINSGVTFIGRYAFFYLYKLKTLIIHDSNNPLIITEPYDNCSQCDDWQYIGAFDYCPLETIYIGRNLKKSSYEGRRDSYFSHVGLSGTWSGQDDTHIKSVKNITFGPYVDLLLGEQYSNGTINYDSQLLSIVDCYPNLQSVTIQNTNYSFVNDVLYNSDNTILYKVMPYKQSDYFRVASTVTQINEYAFKNCVKISEIEVPNGVATIESAAFENCTNLITVTLPNNLSTINYNLFNGCTKLTSLTIPSSVTTINSAFSGCTALANLSVDQNNTVFDSRANCNAIIKKSNNQLIFGCKNTTIPTSVTSIGASAFADCSGLTAITIPNSVTSIEYQAFNSCM